jgi:hypothetical protein
MSYLVDVLSARFVPQVWRFTLKNHRSPERPLIR